MPNVLQVLRFHSAVAMFAAGFLFDFFTLQQIDAWLDLAFQLAYLAVLTGLLVFQHREAEGRWLPGRVGARVWRYNVEALPFLYGGLLSAYVVLYFRSSTGARPALFLALLVGVMGLNEVPRIRRAGYTLHLISMVSACSPFSPTSSPSSWDASTGGCFCCRCCCPRPWCGG